MELEPNEDQFMLRFLHLVIETAGRLVEPVPDKMQKAIDFLKRQLQLLLPPPPFHSLARTLLAGEVRERLRGRL